MQIKSLIIILIIVDNMQNINGGFYSIGLSLASNSNHNSAVCVLDKNKQIVLLDKLYFTEDIKLFFENSFYVKNSILMAALTPDESLLDGKWRIHSKNYKAIKELFEVNRNNWTNRLNDRLKDVLLNLNENKCKVFRCNINLLRQSYGLVPDYLEKTSLDCKSFQSGLKIKYGFNTLSDNLLPAASLEAILCALFGHDIKERNVKTREISDYFGIKVLNRV